jgi:hypothetical protein
MTPVIVVTAHFLKGVILESSEKEGVGGVEKSTRQFDEPAYLLEHRLIDKLTVIVGNCDLLEVKVEAGSEFAKRLDRIRDTAKQMAKELQQEQCRQLEAIKSIAEQKPYVA